MVEALLLEAVPPRAVDAIEDVARSGRRMRPGDDSRLPSGLTETSIRSSTGVTIVLTAIAFAGVSIGRTSATTTSGTAASRTPRPITSRRPTGRGRLPANAPRGVARASGRATGSTPRAGSTPGMRASESGRSCPRRPSRARVVPLTTRKTPNHVASRAASGGRAPRDGDGACDRRPLEQARAPEVLAQVVGVVVQVRPVEVDVAVDDRHTCDDAQGQPSLLGRERRQRAESALLPDRERQQRRHERERERQQRPQVARDSAAATGAAT